MADGRVFVSDNNIVDSMIYSTIKEIRSSKVRPDCDSVHSAVVKNPNLKDLTKDDIEERIITLVNEGILENKKYKGLDSFYIVNNDIEFKDPDLDVDLKDQLKSLQEDFSNFKEFAFTKGVKITTETGFHQE